MEFRVNKASGFPIYQQIKEQIRYQVISGDLMPGARLLSPKDLAAFVGINRNTVIAAYRELEQEGLLMTRQGSGTFVSERTDRPSPPGGADAESLERLVDGMLAEARKLGYSQEDVFTVLYGRIVLGLGASAPARIRVMVVECNEEDASYFCRELERELGVETDFLLVPGLTGHLGDEALLAADFVVTTVMHHEEVSDVLAPLKKDILALNAAPHLQTFMRIAQLPPGTRVGIFCATERGACGMKKAIEDAGITGLDVRACPIGDENGLQAIIGSIDWAITSRYAAARLREMAPPETKFMEFFQVMDKGGLEMLRQYLARRERDARA